MSGRVRKPRRKPGRKPRDPSGAAVNRITIRLTEAERTTWDRIAGAGEMSLADWIRAVCNRVAR